MSGLNHCLTMDPADPNNHLWLYNWVLINWVSQEDKNWSYDTFMTWYKGEYGPNNVEDMTRSFNHEKGNLSLHIIQTFREGTVMKLNEGYGFVRLLPGSGTMAFTIFVANSDPMLTSIRKMRNLDRIDKVAGVEERDYITIAKECGLRS